MNRTLLPLLLLASCSRHDAPPPAASASPVAESASPAAELDHLDTRRPLPLLPMMARHQKQNMQDHLVAVREVVGALASDDYAGIERAGARLGSSESMGRMCSHLGAAAPGFTEQALAFHSVADGVVAAARRKNREQVLAELEATLGACTACHAEWKQSIVDEATWEGLASDHTSRKAPPHPEGAPSFTHTLTAAPERLTK